MSAHRVGVGLVSQTQCDRIHSEFIRESINGASTANVPIDSPGARMKVLATRFMSVTNWLIRTFPWSTGGAEES